MNKIYEDLLTVLTYAEAHVEELPSDLTDANLRYIKTIIENARRS